MYLIFLAICFSILILNARTIEGRFLCIFYLVVYIMDLLVGSVVPNSDGTVAAWADSMKVYYTNCAIECLILSSISVVLFKKLPEFKLILPLLFLNLCLLLYYVIIGNLLSNGNFSDANNVMSWHRSHFQLIGLCTVLGLGIVSYGPRNFNSDFSHNKFNYFRVGSNSGA